jgi:hypothetical protein
MVLPSLLHSLEMGDILEVLEQSDGDEVCNYNGGCEVDVSEAAEWFFCHKLGGTEEELVGDARQKRSCLE